MEIEDFFDEGAGEDELAACRLVMELLSTAGMLTCLAQLRIEVTRGAEATDEDAVRAVTRLFMDLAVPPLAAEGVEPCRRAAGLIRIARQRIFEGVEWETAERSRLN